MTSCFLRSSAIVCPRTQPSARSTTVSKGGAHMSGAPLLRRPAEGWRPAPHTPRVWERGRAPTGATQPRACAEAGRWCAARAVREHTSSRTPRRRTAIFRRIGFGEMSGDQETARLSRLWNSFSAGTRLRGLDCRLRETRLRLETETADYRLRLRVVKCPFRALLTETKFESGTSQSKSGTSFNFR